MLLIFKTLKMYALTLKVNMQYNASFEPEYTPLIFNPR